MNPNKCIAWTALASLLYAAGAGYGQSQTVKGPITYSGDMPLVKAPGQQITAAQEQARTVQVNILEHAAEKALSTGQYADAEAYARQTLSLRPAPYADEILAQALNAEGKDVEALQQYQKIADEGCQFPRILLPYALLLLKAGQYQQAVTAYNTAMPVLTPDDIASIRSGSVGEYDLLRANSNFSPNAPQPAQLATAIHIGLGIELNWSGDHAAALAQYEKAIQLSPDSDLANYYYGYGLKKLGRVPQAQAAFNETIKIAHGGVKVAAVKELTELKHHA